MANKSSSLKRIRTSEKSWLRNLRRKRVVKTDLKTIEKSIEQGNKEADLKTMVVKAYKAIDKAARGSMHKGRADRLKSRLMKKVNKVEAK